MKRSQAVEAIAEKLLHTIGLFGGALDEQETVRDDTLLFRLKIAHNALQAMEELGMKPPYVNKYHHSGNCDDFDELYKWEPE